MTVFLFCGIPYFVPCSSLIRTYGDQLIIIVNMTFWIITKGFAMTLQETQLQTRIHDVEQVLVLSIGPQPKWPIIEKQYHAVKQLSRLLTNLIGTRMAIGLVRITFFYSVTFERIYDVVRFFYLMAYAVTAVALLVFAADGCYQVRFFV